jgi:glycogen synthase
VKVLHVVQGYYPGVGGTEWMIQRVSEELVQQFADEVTVFTSNCYNGEGFFNSRLPHFSVGWETINGVRIRRFPVLSRVSQFFRPPQKISYLLNIPNNQYLRAWAQGPLIPKLGHAIKGQKADVIAASSFPLLHMFTALKAAHQTHRPCVFIGGLHPQDDWGFGRPMIYSAIQKADYYIAYTEYEANYVIQRGCDPEKVRVIGLGVTPEIYTKISAIDAKRRYGLADYPVVGFIGQLGQHKGVDTILRAMPHVWRAVPEARLLLAGSKTMFAEKIEKIVSRWPESDRQKLFLIYNFKEEDKPWLFSAVDVFAYPSGYESFGIAYVEAWAARKPVIGCFRGAIPWVVNAGRDGLLVDFQNDVNLAEAMILLLNNKDWSQALGQAGHKKVLENYTWPIVAERFRRVYTEAIEKATPGKIGTH